MLKEPDEQPIEDVKALQAEINKLKTELRRTTEGRDILKKAAAYFAKVSAQIRYYYDQSKGFMVPALLSWPQRSRN